MTWLTYYIGSMSLLAIFVMEALAKVCQLQTGTEVRLRNRATGLYVEYDKPNSTSVALRNRNFNPMSDYQIFVITALVHPGLYIIDAEGTLNKRWDLGNTAESDGAFINMNEKINHIAQRFKIEEAEPGFYLIKTQKWEKPVDGTNGLGERLVQMTLNSSQTQHWEIISVDPECLYFNIHHERVVRANATLSPDGNPVTLDDCGKICIRTDRCQGFAFRNDTGDCKLGAALPNEPDAYDNDPAYTSYGKSHLYSC